MKRLTPESLLSSFFKKGIEMSNANEYDVLPNYICRYKNSNIGMIDEHLNDDGDPVFYTLYCDDSSHEARL